jgi:solute carrier family 35 protein F5
MIALADTQGQEDSIEGDFIALFGAFMYALYCIFISVKSEQVYLVHMFACVGVLNFVFLMPMFLVLNYSGVEKFEFPPGEVLGFLFLNALFGTVLSDVIWAFSVKYLNPALSTLGITLTIPLSMVVDSVLHGFVYSGLYISGAILVVLGFVIMSMFEHPKYGKMLTNEGLKQKICKKNHPPESNDELHHLNTENN